MKLSVQLYTLRDACARDLPGALGRVAEMGLRFVELAGLHGRSASEWRRLLDSFGLRVSGSHVPIETIRDEPARVVEEAREVGSPHVIVPWLAEGWYADGWEACAKRIEQIAVPVRDAGLGFSYHNHAFELALQDGVPGLVRFYEAADPTLVQAQIDTYWVKFGGQDPASLIRQLAGRIPTVHLKDGLCGSEPRDAEPGRGALDWPEIISSCRAAGVEFGAIEYDHAPRDPMLSVRAAMEYFVGLGVSA